MWRILDVMLLRCCLIWIFLGQQSCRVTFTLNFVWSVFHSPCFVFRKEKWGENSNSFIPLEVLLFQAREFSQFWLCPVLSSDVVVSSCSVVLMIIADVILVMIYSVLSRKTGQSLFLETLQFRFSLTMREKRKWDVVWEWRRLLFISVHWECVYQTLMCCIHTAIPFVVSTDDEGFLDLVVDLIHSFKTVMREWMFNSDSSPLWTLETSSTKGDSFLYFFWVPIMFHLSPFSSLKLLSQSKNFFALIHGFRRNWLLEGEWLLRGKDVFVVCNPFQIYKMTFAVVLQRRLSYNMHFTRMERVWCLSLFALYHGSWFLDTSALDFERDRHFDIKDMYSNHNKRISKRNLHENWEKAWLKSNETTEFFSLWIKFDTDSRYWFPSWLHHLFFLGVSIDSADTDRYPFIILWIQIQKSNFKAERLCHEPQPFSFSSRKFFERYPVSRLDVMMISCEEWIRNFLERGLHGKRIHFDFDSSLLKECNWYFFVVRDQRLLFQQKQKCLSCSLIMKIGKGFCVNHSEFLMLHRFDVKFPLVLFWVKCNLNTKQD